MGNDLDLLDDIFADEPSKKARPVGKFQPKPKFRPQRKDSVKTSVTSSQTVQTIDSAPSELSEPIATANPSEQSSNVVPNGNADLHAVTEKPVGKNADILNGLEALGDVLPQTTTDKECSIPPAAVALNVPNSENIGGSESPIVSSLEDSTHTSNVVDFPTYPGLSADIASATAGEPIVSKADLHDTAHDRDLGREVMDVLDSIDMADVPAKYGQRKGRFQPKQKPKMLKHIKTSEPVSNSLGSQSVPPVSDYAEMDSVPKSHQDDVLDLSSLGFSHTPPTEATSELPLNEESMNLMEVAELDTCIHLDGLPEIPAKLASRRAKTGTGKTHAASDPSSQQQSTQENGTRRSSRPRKGKTICELVDEDRDEVLTIGETEECSPIEEENINNDENQVESELQKKKSKRKSKKADDGKEKPAKKNKKAKEVSDEGGAKVKKFSHSTRRRRVVEKTLLETPEDEIDHQKLPLRDLILLAEYREREMKREGAAAGAPATNQSTGYSSGLYNDGDFNFEGGENNDELGNSPMVDTTEYFNYQSHMDKTRTKRWSKQETELFYEAVRMFGSDLSMIAVRLPGRSRREVKLKYKKEEQQHPLMLHEALANRSKDRSQFEMVVKHLRKIAAEENEDAESMDLPEGTSNADVDDDVAKEEHIGEEENDNAANDEENDNAANDEASVEIPVKKDEVEEEEDDDGEDAYLRWTQYPSSF